MTAKVARLKLPVLFRPLINVVACEFEAKGFCFLLRIERYCRIHRVSYCDPRNPFAALFIQTGRRDDEPALVKLVTP